MLVLTRKLQERISIGQDITITVLRVKGNSVRIGIDAPDHVRVVRGELPRYDVPTPDAPNVARPARPLSHMQRLPGGKCLRASGLAPLVKRISQRCDADETVVISAKMQVVS